MKTYLDPETFEAVEVIEPVPFKKGDVVRCINVDHNEDLTVDRTYTVMLDRRDMKLPFSFMGLPMVTIAEGCFYADRFELVQAAVNAPPLIP